MQSNALHAFVLQQMVPQQLAALMAKTELSLRAATVQSVKHEQKAVVQPVDQDQDL